MQKLSSYLYKLDRSFTCKLVLDCLRNKNDYRMRFVDRNKTKSQQIRNLKIDLPIDKDDEGFKFICIQRHWDGRPKRWIEIHENRVEKDTIKDCFFTR